MTESLSVVVVIPVGPGHARFAQDAEQSVGAAWRCTPGPFGKLEISLAEDSSGLLGRSAARNRGVRAFPHADWYFFLDADDQMEPYAFPRVDLTVAATFGAVQLVSLNGSVLPIDNVWPVTRDTLKVLGASGTLSMGCFVRGDVARSTPFDEALDIGEDFDFYMRLPEFVKIHEPLVSIGYSLPSAGGPRGDNEADWQSACRSVIDRYL